MNDFELIFFIVAFLYIVFDTDAIFEYIQLFKIKCLDYEKFNNARNFPYMPKTFLDYFQLSHNNFLVRLINCPICIGVWLNIFGIIIFDLSFLFLGINIVAVWIIYYILKFIVKIANKD